MVVYPNNQSGVRLQYRENDKRWNAPQFNIRQRESRLW